MTGCCRPRPRRDRGRELAGFGACPQHGRKRASKDDPFMDVALAKKTDQLHFQGPLPAPLPLTHLPAPEMALKSAIVPRGGQLARGAE
jgi:hypothetical protein